MVRSTRQLCARIATVCTAASIIAAPAAADTVETCHGDADMCRTVVAGEAALAAMLVTGDVAVVERLFADDASWSLADGTRWTKAQAIAGLRGAPRMASSELVRADVRQYGDVAVVLWTERWHDPRSGRDEQAFGTDTWMRRHGRWQIIASQEARRPPPPTQP